MGELRSGMSGGGAGNRREVGEVAVVAGSGVAWRYTARTAT